MNGGTLPIATLAATAIALCGAPPAAAATYIVRGADEAELLIPAGVHVEPYSNSGYRLEMDGSTARIFVAAEPLRSREPFRSSTLPPANGTAAKLARALAADAPTRFEAASRVLAWVAANVRYDLDREAPQDAESVLVRRSAYCTGVARLTVALLQSLSIPAREVAGYVVDELPIGGRSGFHRWVEIFYDDRGWVFADPLVSHHLVPASYLRLASSALESDMPGPALMLARRQGLREVDLKSTAPAGRILARANGEERYAAVVHLKSNAPAPAVATLEGDGVLLRRELEAGQVTFFGVRPAAYELRIWSEGRIAAVRRLEIERPDWMELDVAIGALEPVAGIGGTR
jgi:hypothetical protein